MTATARSATGRGSRTSPACWTWTAGPPGCGSSSARSARTRARSCGSPTSTGTGSPPSPPTPGRASSRTWSCATGAGPGARTGSACAKDTGLRNLPLKGFAQNQLWCEIVALACELLAWTQMLALAGDARRWEPKRLRLRLFSVAGRIVRGGRRLRLRLAQRWPWAARDHRRDRPAAGHPVRLTSRNSHYDQERRAPGPVEPRPPGATAGQPGTTERWNPAPGRCLSPPPHERERSRLV